MAITNQARPSNNYNGVSRNIGTMDWNDAKHLALSWSDLASITWQQLNGYNFDKTKYNQARPSNNYTGQARP